MVCLKGHCTVTGQSCVDPCHYKQMGLTNDSVSLPLCPESCCPRGRIHVPGNSTCTFHSRCSNCIVHYCILCHKFFSFQISNTVRATITLYLEHWNTSLISWYPYCLSCRTFPSLLSTYQTVKFYWNLSCSMYLHGSTLQKIMQFLELHKALQNPVPY